MRTSWEIYTPYAGPDGILEERYGKFTIVKLKLSHLSYNEVEYFPFSMVTSMSRYDSFVSHSVNDMSCRLITVFVLQSQYISCYLVSPTVAYHFQDGVYYRIP